MTAAERGQELPRRTVLAVRRFTFECGEEGTCPAKPAASRFCLRQPQAPSFRLFDPFNQVVPGIDRPSSIDQSPYHVGLRNLAPTRQSGGTFLIELDGNRRHGNTVILPRGACPLLTAVRTVRWNRGVERPRSQALCGLGRSWRIIQDVPNLSLSIAKRKAKKVSSIGMKI